MDPSSTNQVHAYIVRIIHGRIFFRNYYAEFRNKIQAHHVIFIFGILTLIGNLLSDIIMSIIDPRIRIQ